MMNRPCIDKPTRESGRDWAPMKHTCTAVVKTQSYIKYTGQKQS